MHEQRALLTAMQRRADTMLRMYRQLADRHGSGDLSQAQWLVGKVG